MKRCSMGFVAFSLILQALSWVFSGVFLGLFFIGDPMPSKYEFTLGAMFLAALSWVALLMLTASLVYQAWGCVHIKNSRLVPSNFNTESISAIAFVLMNVFPVIFASVAGTNGLNIDVGIGKESLSSIFAVVMFFSFLLYTAYSQIRRNMVRDFLNEKTEKRFGCVLKKTNALESF